MPYGRRTGVKVVDRLNIIAHDKFKEIVEEANREDSMVKLKELKLSDEALAAKVTVPVVPKLNQRLGYKPPQADGSLLLHSETESAASTIELPQSESDFNTVEEEKVAQIAHKVIQELERQPELVPNTAALQSSEVRNVIKEKVENLYKPEQLEIEGVSTKPDITAVVAKTTEIIQQQTIDIPKIIVVPVEPIETFYEPFTLDLSGLTYEPPEETLWIQSLATNEGESLGMGAGSIEEKSLENHVVSSLLEFDDISYYDHAELTQILHQSL